MWKIGNHWIRIDEISTIQLIKYEGKVFFRIFMKSQIPTIEITDLKQVQAMAFFLEKVQAHLMIDIEKLYESKDKVLQMIEEVSKKQEKGK